MHSKATIAHNAHKFFTSRDGEIVIDYLRSITMNTVLQPPIDPNEAVYMEGRRSVYADIMQLIETAERLLEKQGADKDGRTVTNLWNRANNRINGSGKT